MPGIGNDGSWLRVKIREARMRDCERELGAGLVSGAGEKSVVGCTMSRAETGSSTSFVTSDWPRLSRNDRTTLYFRFLLRSLAANSQPPTYPQ